jgi:DHA1 family tetracycline resistance protein-like MFS transporter
MSTQPTPARAAKAASWFIFIAVLLDMASLGIMITVLPSLIGQLGGSANAGWINGVFVGVWALVQFVCSPVLGALSDRFGRRPVLLLSMAGLGLDYIIMALAPDLWWLLVGRLISGVTASSFSTCYAYVADITAEEERAAAFGKLGAAFGLGFILGPAVGGLLGAVSLRAPFWVAAGFSLLNAGFGVFVLPESLPKALRSPFSWAKANPVGALKLLRSHPELAGLSWTHILSQFAGASIASVYVLYVVRRYGWSTPMVGTSLALVGLGVAVVQGLLVGRATAKLGERRLLVLGLAAGALSLAVFALAPWGGLFLLGIPIFCLWGLSGPALMAIMSRRVSASEQGQLNGAVASLTSLSDGIGPFFFGAVFSVTAGAAATGAQSGIAFLLAAGFIAAATLMAIGILRRNQAEEVQPS